MFERPNWDLYAKDFIDDGKYNTEFPIHHHRPESMIPFPGYIDNKDHPFTFFNFTGTDEKGDFSNKFASSDDIITFKKNLRKQPADWKYRTKEVFYNYNKSGYRTYEWNEIDWKNAIVILGCSCTYGEGLAEDETISYHIEKRTGRQVVNLGYPAGSNKLILDNAASIIKNFDMPYAVIINWTTSDRTRFYYENGYRDLGPWNKFIKSTDKFSKWTIDLNDYWKKTFFNPGNEYAQTYYLSTYADAMFNGRTNYYKISFFDTTAHFTRSDAFFTIDNGARDCIHPGEGNSIEIADYITQRLKEDNNE